MGGDMLALLLILTVLAMLLLPVLGAR